MQNFKRLWFCAALAAPVALCAQQVATAPVEISVNDPSGAGVAHARVRIVPSPVDAGKKLETNEKGRLELALKARS